MPMTTTLSKVRPSAALRKSQSLLDVATTVLVTEPGTSLSAVAQAAGVSRTTLHKYFPSRDDLLRAVGERALDLCEAAILPVNTTADRDDYVLTSLTTALLSVGAQLGFLWRTPAFDHEPTFMVRWRRIEEELAISVLRIRRVEDRENLRAPWWDVSALLALVYVASESIYQGRLAPLDAPELVSTTFLKGIG